MSELKATFRLDLSEIPADSAKAMELINSAFASGAKGGKKLSLNDWLSHDPMKEGGGMGEKIGNGIKKGIQSSFGGGISQILNMPALVKEFESQVDSVFNVAPEAKLDSMLKKSKEKFAVQKQKEEEKEKADFVRQSMAASRINIKRMRDAANAPEQGPDLSGRQFRDWIKAHSVKPPEMKGTEGSNLASVQSLPDINDLKDAKPDWKKMLVGLGLGFTNPYVGSRLLSDELGKGKDDSVAGGLFGKGGIAGFAEIYGAFKVFKFSVEVFKSTVENASKMYSKALQSGMGIGFSVKRSMLADIMGVSEEDVLKFGSQLAYLNPKLELAASTISKTTQSLTELSWGCSIAGKNISALWAQLVDGLSPGINELIDDFNGFLEVLIKSDFMKQAGQVLNVVLVMLGDVVGLVEVAVMGFVTGLHVIADEFSVLIMGILNFFAKIPGLGKLGGWDTSEAKKDEEQSATDLANLAAKVWSNGLGKTANNVPSPQSYMKQLPASAWEKMGLISGSGNGNNYAKETAKNTKELVQGIKALVKAVSKPGSAGSWNMSPNVAQP